MAPYYPEAEGQYYPDYGYPVQQASISDPGLERQGLEAALGAPIIITAFAAAVVGGILSPMITAGLNRLGEYTIEWPEVKRKVPGNLSKKKISENEVIV